jgi:hypothetical protein
VLRQAVKSLRLGGNLAATLPTFAYPSGMPPVAEAANGLLHEPEQIRFLSTNRD